MVTVCSGMCVCVGGLCLLSHKRPVHLPGSLGISKKLCIVYCSLDTRSLYISASQIFVVVVVLKGWCGTLLWNCQNKGIKKIPKIPNTSRATIY